MRLPYAEALLDRAWLLGSGAVNIDVDPTAIAQLVLFTAFAVMMKPLVFDPLMRVFEERERQTVGAKQDARKIDEDAIALKHDLDKKLDGIRREASIDREQIRASLSRSQAEILAQARTEMQARLDEGLARVGEEVAKTRSELEAERSALAAEIAGKVLGRKVGKTVDA